MDKQCFKCKETKSTSEFYRHPAMGDGFLGKCKTCAKRDVAEREQRLKDNQAWVAKERTRCREKSKRMRGLGLQKRSSPEAKRRWEIKNRHKRNAQSKAKRAVRSGKLPVKSSCESCGSKVKLHKHHPDYSKPLQVVFLCPPCHGRAHWKTGPIQRPCTQA